MKTGSVAGGKLKGPELRNSRGARLPTIDVVRWLYGDISFATTRRYWFSKAGVPQHFVHTVRSHHSSAIVSCSFMGNDSLNSS